MIAMASVFWWRSKSKLMIGLALLAPCAGAGDVHAQRMVLAHGNHPVLWGDDRSAMGRINA